MPTTQIRMATSFLFAVLATAVVVAIGCAPKSVGRSELSAKSGDREVKAAVDGGAFISSQDGITTLNFGGGKLVVEKNRVELAGKEIAKLPEDAKRIEIDFSAGHLTMKADGESVYSADIKK